MKKIFLVSALAIGIGIASCNDNTTPSGSDRMEDTSSMQSPDNTQVPADTSSSSVDTSTVNPSPGQQ